MAAVAATWVVRWAGQLAGVSDTVLQKVPEDDDWLTIRHFMKNMSRLLRKGDVIAGAKAFGQILPYVQVTMFCTWTFAAQFDALIVFGHLHVIKKTICLRPYRAVFLKKKNRSTQIFGI